MKQYLCKNCGEPKKSRKENTLCLKCYRELNRGNNHPRYKAAGICPKCGGKKTADNNHAKFCRKCNEHKGEKHWNYGKHWSDEVKMKISKGNMDKRMEKDNHKFNPNKQTRRTYRFPYKKWRLEVLKRDKNSCLCGRTNCNIVHHINPYRDTPDNLDINNGITLCSKCHAETFGKEYLFIKKFEEHLKNAFNSGELSS